MLTLAQLKRQCLVCHQDKVWHYVCSNWACNRPKLQKNNYKTKHEATRTAVDPALSRCECPSAAAGYSAESGVCRRVRETETVTLAPVMLKGS